MPSGKPHKDILQASLTRGQVQQLGALITHRIEQRRNGLVRLAHVQTNQAIVVADRFDSGQRAPSIESIAIRKAGFKFNDVVTPETVNQIGRRTFGDDLAVIHDCQAVTQALGLVHVVRR